MALFVFVFMAATLHSSFFKGFYYYCTLFQHPVSAKGGNTSNLFSDLKFKHPKEFCDVEKTRKSQHSKAEKKVCNNQPKIAESIKSSQKYSRSSKQWEKMTNSVTLLKTCYLSVLLRNLGFRVCCPLLPVT